MNDHLWNFPTTALALALDGIATLRADLGLSDTAQISALGDPRDDSGAIATPATWIGRPGIPATSYEGMDGKSVDVPAKGDPRRYYMHLRVDGEAPTFDPSGYGLVPTDPAESAAVLGVWAGDEVPN